VSRQVTAISAHEATYEDSIVVAAGENLTASQTAHGWTWCSNQQGKSDWVPSRNLR
jgi:hypothetical protein